MIVCRIVKSKTRNETIGFRWELAGRMMRRTRVSGTVGLNCQGGSWGKPREKVVRWPTGVGIDPLRAVVLTSVWVRAIRWGWISIFNDVLKLNGDGVA